MSKFNEIGRTEAIIEEWEGHKQTILNLIFSSLFFLVVAFISDFVGIGDWIRRNAVWFILFVVALVELDLTSTMQALARFIKSNTRNENEALREKIGHLELDVDYIKNIVKELKNKGSKPD